MTIRIRHNPMRCCCNAQDSAPLRTQAAAAARRRCCYSVLEGVVLSSGREFLRFLQSQAFMPLHLVIGGDVAQYLHNDLSSIHAKFAFFCFIFHRVDPVVAGVKAEHKELPSERRSRAKRLWWEQVKQLDLRLSSGGAGSAISEESVEDLLSSMPKFLLAELFPDPTSTSASGSNPPSPSTEQHEESGPTEDSSQYLARSMALLRCRQYRHDMIAQMDLQQRTRPHRHYNARGIHIASNKDACDCLQPNCPGCHFPCPKCNSQKCGDECRSNRNYVYEQIEVDGYTNAVFTNSLLA
ncbi:hypothetical protein HPB51_014652 [Rhipicephalus microplus]|uniref:ARF7 effector protein C-terminal domain-containing protein n=1 Tax=Rhipicephalus microplus TaxID=6941 RepID=A0A9J6F3X2_RHIMP|nr:hypothetical protein HPB51_014652 [Rhipicephalus microplus]